MLAIEAFPLGQELSAEAPGSLYTAWVRVGAAIALA
jgi:hypothetical protein